MLKDDLYDRTPDDERAEREELGFQRQPEVRWLTPSLLAKSGVEVVVSGAFGKFADKRELQTADQGDLRYGAAGEDLWVDYLSDTGDGWNATYTMAWLLAREQLGPAGVEHELPRGTVLLLGGDQVYPSATPIAYEDRFKGPFACALPTSPPGGEPHMFATPGNHDWYDGLASFLRLFCAKGTWIGGWKTRQRRSYFALELPNDWWIWAIDIQLDTYIDDVQLDYFRDQDLQPGDKVVLMTAKPSWVKAKPGMLEPISWKYLAFFEDRMIRDRNARLAVVLTGDLHHYARYEPTGRGKEAPTRITAGGGGAYLSATHTLTDRIELQSMSKKPYLDPNHVRPGPAREPEPEHEREPVVYKRRTIYPVADDSKRLGKGILKLRRLNPEFALLFGGLYAVIALAMVASLNAAPGDLELTTSRFATFLSGAFGPLPLLLVAVLLFGGTFGGTDLKAAAGEKAGRLKLLRALVAAVHGLAHLVTITLVVYLAVELLAGVPDHLEIWPGVIEALTRLLLVPGVAAVLALFAGTFVGTNLWAFVMYLVHRGRGSKAPGNANEVFTGQSIVDYKSFLRMRFDRDGGLTIYPLGVDRICTTWDYAGRQPAGSRFEPRDGDAPAVRLVDQPLRYDAGGDPLHTEAAPAAT